MDFGISYASSYSLDRVFRSHICPHAVYFYLKVMHTDLNGMASILLLVLDSVDSLNQSLKCKSIESVDPLLLGLGIGY